MDTARFEVKGTTPLKVQIVATNVRAGSYTLLLWEAGKNIIVVEHRGNFINAEDDVFDLPLPNKANIRRLVECIVTAVAPPNRKGSIGLTVSQDGTKLATDTGDVDEGPGSNTVDLFILLEEK
ncbi:MAG: hypothetical protein ABR543_03775 [Gemmatimonadaceae bacterium]